MESLRLVSEIGLMTVVGETLGAGRKEEAVYYIKKISIAAEVVLIATCLFDVWAYLSDHIFWRHGTRECKTLYIHGNMYHDRKTDRVDHGIYSTIWIQGSRRC